MSRNEYGLPLSRVGCASIVEEKERAWLLRLKTNELYEVDRINNKTKVLKRFTDGAMKGDFLYLAIEKVEDILILGSGTASNVAFYDLADGVCEYMELVPAVNDRKIKYTGACNFCKSCTYGNSVYLLGYEYPAILKIDMDTGEAAYLTDWVVEVEERISKPGVLKGYVSDYVIVDNIVWALCECTNVVLRLDLRTDEIEVMDICSDLDIQCGICFDGNFWVTGNNEYGNKLLKYDAQFVLEKEIEVYSAKAGDENYGLSLDKGHWATYPVIDLGEKFLLFSVYPSHVYEFDKALERVSIHPVFEELIDVRDERFYDLKILVPRRKGNFICFVTGNDFLWNEYEFIHDALIRYAVRTEDDERVLQEYGKVLTGRIIEEDNFIWDLGYKLTLPRFLEHMKYVSSIETADMGKNGDVGIRIHKECWEALEV